ncbi:hypothetical protein HanXRQr2_Chr10g0430961 [Helianthus annuus]|uniref:Uncharacterized protein n=1 Tax=Helianthus annuus TaxID=4232 RepID=A0A251TLT3_HELAN|nr:hypothetical protein HanXRQr2_Chr10g0430961 [Helianthus annuus]
MQFRCFRTLTTSSRLGKKLDEKWVVNSVVERSLRYRKHRASLCVTLHPCVYMELLEQICVMGGGGMVVSAVSKQERKEGNFW